MQFCKVGENMVITWAFLVLNGKNPPAMQET